MSDYIVCEKKKNAPRMDVRVCIRKCPEREHCEGFQQYLRQADPDMQALALDSNSKSFLAVATAG